ncbi:conserved hypothetical protein [Talaromyces stipitatus ATCC 10500]|uniref:Senescence domain-containing protein n=1 Tax=Talaromyces stipitatus (strain ATCC 10500 / CBS 375.48 / QM 6759 / NRRL 1006) TaxID=441959 RepID=B8M2V9_TALSN|nr:uncharacterized protein TSTA_094600 [Talaromyces stipitatus ATCC 10500]EED22214.1 conserved hypothetical protein [Talaromyces stipitatus ATCC 10500]
MASTQGDPRVLYSINNIRAYHLQDGEETDLTPSGPQTLSLLMVPTVSPAQQQQETGSAPEEDFYLHLHLPPELDMPLPATTQIYHQPPNSYLIPRWDLGPDAGAFIRLQFPGIGSGAGKVSQEDVDTFETILAQCTAFLERAAPPSSHAPYNPADYAPGEGYISSSDQKSSDGKGQIVLVDEEDGSVVGELSEGYKVVEKPDVKPGSKNPVEIQLPSPGEDHQISVSNVSEEYLRMARHPAYKDSTIVQTSARASRLIVTGSAYLANKLTTGADSFAQRTKPNPEPLNFSPATQERIRKVHNLSQSAVGLSARTVGSIGRVAQNLGANLARRKDMPKGSSRQGYDSNGNPVNIKTGVLNKSLIAFTTLMDGIEEGARTVLNSGSTAATSMIQHRYGPEAGNVASDITRGFRNVGLVYIDATGVSRRAVLKSVARGMIVGRMHNGQQVVVGSGDGGQVPPDGSSGKTEYAYYGGSNNGLGNSNTPRSSSRSRLPAPPRRLTRTPSPPPAYGAAGTYSLPGGNSTTVSGKR